MDGQAVFKQAVTVLDRSARDTCAEAGVDVSEVDWLIPHQANVRILNFLARKLSVPTEGRHHRRPACQYLRGQRAWRWMPRAATAASRPASSS